jgi:hypothetical protein
MARQPNEASPNSALIGCMSQRIGRRTAGDPHVRDRKLAIRLAHSAPNRPAQSYRAAEVAFAGAFCGSHASVQPDSMG